jgi:hypothetical protein
MAHFEGVLQTEWLVHAGPDRKMKVLKNFTFVDDQGKRWVAPKGSVVDGASIPPELWSSVIGTPFVGDYRRATVLHDVACQQRVEPHKAVHRMFYEAMIADGVDEIRAQVMYLAVRSFGPTWSLGAARGADGSGLETTRSTAVTIDQLEAALDVILAE